MNDLKYTPLWKDGPRYTAGEAFPLSTDAVLLADFARPKKKNSYVADFGCGSGILGLLIKFKDPSVRLIDIDLIPYALEIAQKNMAANNLEENVEYICGDFQDMKEMIPASCLDLIVCNPPYYSTDRGASSPKEDRRIARSEISCSLDQLFSSAARHLRSGGRICLVYKPDRLAELLLIMAKSRIECKKLRFVQHSKTHRPSLVLIEGRLDGNPGVQVEPVLILHEQDGTMTQEAQAIYHQIESEVN